MFNGVSFFLSYVVVAIGFIEFENYLVILAGEISSFNNKFGMRNNSINAAYLMSI